GGEVPARSWRECEREERSRRHAAASGDSFAGDRAGSAGPWGADQRERWLGSDGGALGGGGARFGGAGAAAGQGRRSQRPRQRRRNTAAQGRQARGGRGVCGVARTRREGRCEGSLRRDAIARGGGEQ